MGKKVKKDEKAPPEDVFDTLLVESRQAATVVLMLSSPEEDVQAKAGEAIYKFVDKCDENKKTLLDLGVIEPLLKLMASEDRLARRNACMALGTMCANSDVRKCLRKREESISTFVNLLAPEEDTVIHEFASLGLSALAQEFTSKVVINESSGVEPLVRCLSSSDADVQKNSIEAIAQLMLDYQTRSNIREFEGLAPILELLKSEYAIIQKLALLALERCAQDVENRSRLRELEAISKLINFIAHPEWNDLHVMSVMVISSLLEDRESLEQIKETGGLKKLVAIITDQQPPEEEAAAKKPDKKAGGKGGKKSAKESAKKQTEEKDEQKDGENVIPTLPDVKMSAAKAIGRSARNKENRKILHEQEAEKMLIILLSHENVDVQASAAQALGIMCENLSSRDSVREMDGIAPLIKLLNSENGDVKEAAALALANLTSSNSANAKEVMNLGGVEPLIHVLSDQREEAVSNAACVLTNMAQDESLRSDIVSKGAVTALIDPLKSGNAIVQSKTALACAAYLCDQEARSEFRIAGGLEPLVEFLISGNDDVRRSAAWAITVCGVDDASAVEICKLGGLGVLQEIQLSGSRRSPFTDAALDRLLDSNLSAKYALSGKLGYNNLVEDGFYDSGQMKQGSKFLSLEDFCNQDLNDKRPIILINPKPEIPSSESKSEEIKTESSKTSLSGKSSRTGRDSKSKTKAQKEKEEKQKEELQAQLQKEADAQAVNENNPFVTPVDPLLLSYIEEVSEKVQPLSSSREQVIALAQLVSEKMGGPIDRGQVSSFSWELPLSQVKYELKSNVVPIGKLKAGIHVHRALLFKTLADRIALCCTLVRGQYNRAWNEVMLYGENENLASPKFPPKEYLVDLIHQPGRLIPIDSPDAVSYQKI